MMLNMLPGLLFFFLRQEVVEHPYTTVKSHRILITKHVFLTLETEICFILMSQQQPFKNNLGVDKVEECK